MSYAIQIDNSILRSDGAVITPSSDNREYIDYLYWVAAGNTATPYSAPLPTWSDIQGQAKAQLDDSDTSMHRVTEAVTLGLTTLTASDVVAFANWRRALRAIVQASTGDPTTGLPVKPVYPAHT